MGTPHPLVGGIAGCTGGEDRGGRQVRGGGREGGGSLVGTPIGRWDGRTPGTIAAQK